MIVAIHGGFWRSQFGLDENDKLVEDLVRRGYAVWNIEYRRTGEEGGGWPGTFYDAVAAVNYLKQLSELHPLLDLSRVMLLGHSAGGQLALWLASRTFGIKRDELGEPLQVPVRGVISLAGITDLRRMWEIHNTKAIQSPIATLLGGPPHERQECYSLVSPVELMPPYVEQFLIHGALDRHVPVELSIEYYQKAMDQGGQVHLKVLPGADHFQIIDSSSQAWSTVTDVLETINNVAGRERA